MNKIKNRKVKYFHPLGQKNVIKKNGQIQYVKWNSPQEINKSKMMKILESMILKQDLIKFKNK